MSFGHVFLSHATPDRADAEALCAALEERGLRCWICSRDIPGGEDWGKAIADAMKNASVLIFLLSRSSADRGMVKGEVVMAGSAGIPILTLRRDDTKVPSDLTIHLVRYNWIDAFDGPITAYVDRIASDLTAMVPIKPIGNPLPSKSSISPRPVANHPTGGTHSPPGQRRTHIGPVDSTKEKHRTQSATSPIRLPHSTDPLRRPVLGYEGPQRPDFRLWGIIGGFVLLIVLAVILLPSFLGNNSTGVESSPLSEKKAQEYLDNGQDQAQLDEYAEAIRLYTLALKNKPDWDLALINRGMAYVYNDEYDKGIADFEAVLAQDPGNEQAELLKSQAQRMKKDAQKGDSQASSNGPEASGMRKSAPSRRAPSDGTAFGRGIGYYEQEEYEKAIPLLEQAGKEDPDNANVFLNLGMAQWRSGRWADAVESMTEALLLAPDMTNANSYNVRGRCNMELENYQAAYDDFTKVLEMVPDSYNIRAFRALASLRLNRVDDASHDAEQLVKSDPEEYWGYELRGRCRLAKGEYQSALDDFDRGIEIQSSDADLYLYRSRTLDKMGRSSDADAALTKARSMKPTVDELPSP